MTDTLERYEILEKIGQGGFAVVYRARDTKLGRMVALKELRPVLLHDTDWVRRFRREARTIAHLDHPRIVAIHDVVETDQRLVLVIQLVNGPGLDEVIKSQGRFTWPEALKIITAVAQGLDYAHAKGVLHRDLKPGNILLDADRGPMLADFGLAKLAGENSVSVTSGGGVVGTPHYIAPEVWEARGTTPRSDIYALGCILYEMLTGEKIFKGETPPEVMLAHFKPPVLPNTWPDGVPPGVTNVLKKALASDPAKRYATAGDMAQALAALPLTEATPEPSQPPEQVTPSAARTPQPQISAAKAFEPFPDTTDDLSADWPDEMEQSTGGLSGKWKGFLAHLGPYIIVMTMLGFINALTSDYPWFLWPALGWGVGLAFHLMGIGLSEMKGVSENVRGFAGHLGSYAIITALLIMIYLLSGGGYPWFLWPAGIWGAVIAIHLWTMMLTGDQTDKSSTQATRRTGHKRRAERRDQRREWRPARQEAPPKQAAPKSDEVVSTVIQAHLNKAKLYQEQIQTLIKSTSNQHSRARLKDLSVQVDDWTQAIAELACRVDRLQQNPIIRQDIASVPEAIKKLEAQIATESDATTKTELERTLSNRKNQLASLQYLQNSIRRAEIKIESTLSALGTIYSQILTGQSTDHVADYGRLSVEAEEEVRTLQDQLEALEEVKLGHIRE